MTVPYPLHAFDNAQILRRRWRPALDADRLTSIGITIVIHVVILLSDEWPLLGQVGVLGGRPHDRLRPHALGAPRGLPVRARRPRYQRDPSPTGCDAPPIGPPCDFRAMRR